MGPILAKKYVLLREDSSGPLAKDIREKYKVGRNSVTIITPDGDVLARLTNEPSAEDVLAAVDGLPDFRAGMEQLAKLKEKGLTKANAESFAAALSASGRSHRRSRGRRSSPTPKATAHLTSFSGRRSWRSASTRTRRPRWSPT